MKPRFFANHFCSHLRWYLLSILGIAIISGTATYKKIQNDEVNYKRQVYQQRTFLKKCSEIIETATYSPDAEVVIIKRKAFLESHHECVRVAMKDLNFRTLTDDELENLAKELKEENNIVLTEEEMASKPSFFKGIIR